MANAGTLVVTLEASTANFTTGLNNAQQSLNRFQAVSGSSTRAVTAMERGFASFAAQAVGMRGPLEQVSKGFLLFGGGPEAVLGVAAAVTAASAAMKLFGLGSEYSAQQLATFREETAKLRETGLAGITSKLGEARAAITDSSKPGLGEMLLSILSLPGSGVNGVAGLFATGAGQARARQQTQDSLDLLTVSGERNKALIGSLAGQAAELEKMSGIRRLTNDEQAEEARLAGLINQLYSNQNTTLDGRLKLLQAGGLLSAQAAGLKDFFVSDTVSAQRRYTPLDSRLRPGYLPSAVDAAALVGLRPQLAIPRLGINAAHDIFSSTQRNPSVVEKALDEANKKSILRLDLFSQGLQTVNDLLGVGKSKAGGFIGGISSIVGQSAGLTSDTGLARSLGQAGSLIGFLGIGADLVSSLFGIGSHNAPLPVTVTNANDIAKARSGPDKVSINLIDPRTGASTEQIIVDLKRFQALDGIARVPYGASV